MTVKNKFIFTMKLAKTLVTQFSSILLNVESNDKDWTIIEQSKEQSKESHFF